MPRPPEPGVYRIRATGGEVAVIQYDHNRRVIELVQVGRGDPPARRTAKYLGRDLGVVKRDALRRRQALFYERLFRGSDA